jgi:hypothetical protein
VQRAEVQHMINARPIDSVLERLAVYGLRPCGADRWRARCPAHDGHNADALAISAGDDGRVLLHCFAGCDVAAIVDALHLELHDLFPPTSATPGDGVPRLRPPFVPAQAFDAARLEVAVAAIIASHMLHGLEIAPDDRDRLHLAAHRLDDIARSAYGRRS